MTHSEPNQSPSPAGRPYGVSPGVVKNNKINIETELWNLDSPLPEDSVAENDTSTAESASDGDNADNSENPIVLVADDLPVIEENSGVRVIEEISIMSESETRQTTRRPRLSARRRRDKEAEPEPLNAETTAATERQQAEHHYIPDKSTIIRPHETNIWESLENEETPSASTATATKQDAWLEDDVHQQSTPTHDELASVAAELANTGSDATVKPTPNEVQEVALTDSAASMDNSPITTDDKTSSDDKTISEDLLPAESTSMVAASSEEATNALETPTAETSTKSQAFRIPRISHVERVTLMVFAALVLVGAVTGVVAFYRNIPAQIDPYRMPKLPIIGKIVRITNARTYWRAPIRSGADADTTKADTIMLPVVEITIDNCPQASGALRLFFRNEHNELVGDPITRAYKNMVFDANGKATLPMASTFGFNDFGAHQAYRAEKALPWKIEVFEGPSETAPRESFKKISTLPISSNQQ